MIKYMNDSTSNRMKITAEEYDKIINSKKSKSFSDPYSFSRITEQAENLPRYSVSAKEYKKFADHGVYLNAYTSREQAEKQRVENQINKIGSMGIVAVIILSVLVAWMGAKRKIGFGWALFFSLMLSPVVGLIVVLCSRKREPDFVEMDK